MKKYTAGRGPAPISPVAAFAFLCSLALCSLFVVITIKNKANVEALHMERLILEKALRINDAVSKLLYKTNSLSAIVQQGGDIAKNFAMLAPSIVDSEPSIMNVLIAPDGVVSTVYPLAGNEAVLGLNFFGAGAGNREAVAARDQERMVVGGPFKSVQGGEILVGRLPVYIDSVADKSRFWGLVSVTLKFPQVLDNADLGVFRNQGFSYELWRTNPDTEERQVILYDHEHAKPNARAIEKHISVVNTDWYLKVWSGRSWYNYPENLALVVASILISLLIMFITQSNFELKRMKLILEGMAKSDPLTGISNRRNFMEIARMNIERARRTGEDNCYIILFDLDRFKSINDTHGHIVGDNVLIDVTTRIKAAIRPYDLFARYGGEEFILWASLVNEKEARNMAERLRLSICDKPFKFDGTTLSVSASFGAARIDGYNLESAIPHADKALYQAKNGGRNRVVFWED